MWDTSHILQFIYLHINSQDTLYLCQCLVYLMIESLTLLEIVGKEFGWRQNLLVLFRELAQVVVAIGSNQLLHWIAA